MKTSDTSLDMVSPPATVRIVGIKAGRGLRCHLSALGLFPGAKIRVLSKPAKGQAMVQIFNSKTMLGQGVMEKIYVSPLTEDSCA